MVTGIDLIKAQIRIAAGETAAVVSRPISCSAARRSNAASTPRIRDATSNRRPGGSSNSLPPGGFGVRFDSHAYSGYVVPPYYDSMIGKLIVHQPTRAEAIASHAASACRIARRRASRRRSRCIRRFSAIRRSSNAASTRRSSNARLARLTACRRSMRLPASAEAAILPRLVVDVLTADFGARAPDEAS